MCLELESLGSTAVTQVQLNFREAGFANTLRQIKLVLRENRKVGSCIVALIGLYWFQLSRKRIY